MRVGSPNLMLVGYVCFFLEAKYFKMWLKFGQNEISDQSVLLVCQYHIGACGMNGIVVESSQNVVTSFNVSLYFQGPTMNPTKKNHLHSQKWEASGPPSKWCAGAFRCR